MDSYMPDHLQPYTLDELASSSEFFAAFDACKAFADQAKRLFGRTPKLTFTEDVLHIEDLSEDEGE